jgi:hypothetical protein
MCAGHIDACVRDTCIPKHQNNPPQQRIAEATTYTSKGTKEEHVYTFAPLIGMVPTIRDMFSPLYTDSEGAAPSVFGRNLQRQPVKGVNTQEGVALVPRMLPSTLQASMLENELHHRVLIPAVKCAPHRCCCRAVQHSKCVSNQHRQSCGRASQMPVTIAEFRVSRRGKG